MMNDKESLNRAKDEISHKFDKIGLINSDDTALILAANMSTKDRHNSIFVITDESMPQLHEQILNLINNDTNEDVIKFQIIFFSGSTHAMFGEFQIDKTKDPPLVRYLHCDPMPSMIEYSVIITPSFVKKISPIADIEICDSNVVLLKGKGCSYLSIDGALMLATPSDREYVPNVSEYIKKHGQEKEALFEEKNVKYILSNSLPARFVRGSHHVDDWKGQRVYIKGLTSTIFNTSEKNTIVNKKGESAEQSIRRDLESQQVASKNDPNKMETKIGNMRAERKMKQHKEKVLNFIKDKDILSPEFSDQIDQFKIKGLVQFCKEKIVQPKLDNSSPQRPS